MKLFTHRFKVTIFSNGSFCWKNARWERKPIEEIAKDFAISACLNLLLLLIIAY